MNSESEKILFKKPVVQENSVQIPEKITNKNQTDENVDVSDTDNYPLQYEEPSWFGVIEDDMNYAFEVIKFGKIVENIPLKSKSFWVFGRKPNCDVYMLHSTISRYHAILQYGNETGEISKGFYLYDLGSKHGTFLNKNRLKPRVYVRVQVGHMIKLGSSTRTFLLTGPEEDTEAESVLTVTELKQKRRGDLIKREKEEKDETAKREIALEKWRKKEEEQCVDWGMGDDADEETDLSENPYAQTNNEELYLDDPKKALRGFMEREGIPFEYDCSEQGMGQFLCKVELPLDDERGRPIFAEVLHKGKKKEAVVQCALEACRILDRHGILRQAKHEPRKRKTKNWKENDYYDSDDDIYLDRTGSVEKKREKRMKIVNPPQAETYASLLEKETKISEEIASIEKQLFKVKESKSSEAHRDENEEDSLESFMKNLSDTKPDKQKVGKLKSDLIVLKKEHENLLKLLNISRPADLPVLKQTKNKPNEIKSKQMPLFGKRLKVKVQVPQKPHRNPDKKEGEEIEIDEDEEADSVESQKEIVETKENHITFQICEALIAREEELVKEKRTQIEILGAISKNIITDLASGSKTEELTNLQNQIQKFLSNHQRLLKNRSNDNLNFRKSVDEFRKQLITVTETNIAAKQDTGEEVNSEEVNSEEVNNEVNSEEVNREESEKRKRKNQRRIQQRQEKMIVEKSKGYIEDASKEDYNMWVPPTNQTGDGRISLNEKLGY